MLDDLAVLIVVQVVADKARSHVDGQIGDRTLQLGDSGLLLGLDRTASLFDHLGRLSLGLVGDVGLDSLARSLRIRDDLRGLSLSFLELALVLGKRALGFCLGFLRLLKGFLDGALALRDDVVNHGPTELGQHDENDDEGNEHRNELIHIGNEHRDAFFLLRGEREGGESTCKACCRCSCDTGLCQLRLQFCFHSSTFSLSVYF